MFRRISLILIFALIAVGPAFAAEAGTLKLSHLKKIAIQVIPSPGRGNIGAAVIAANQLRTAGFEGEITFIMPWRDFPKDDHLQKIFASMVRHYNPKAVEVSTVGTAAQRFRALNVSYRKHGGSNVLSNDIIQELGGQQDLLLTVGTLTSGLSIAKVSITLGLFTKYGDQIRIEEWNSSRQLWKIELPLVLGLGGLGHHHDDVVEKALAVEKTAKSGRQAVSAATVALLREAATNNENLAHYRELAAMIQNLAALDSNFGIAYGVGLQGTHGQFSAYLESLAKKSSENRQASVVFSVSQLTSEEIRGIAEKAGAISTIDLQRGDKVPSRFRPGRTYLVHVGGVPRDVYGRLMVLSNLPPIVSGDSALSAALTLGRPFVSTRSDLSVYSRKQFFDELESTGKHRPLLQALRLMDDQRRFDFDALSSKDSQEFFSKLREEYKTPLAINMARLADRIIEDPEAAREELSVWKALAQARSLSIARCEHWLTQPTPAEAAQ